MKGLILLLGLVFGLASIFAQSNAIEGTYKQINDKTGEIQSIIELSIKNGKLYGTIKQLFVQKSDEELRCTNCTGEQKDQPYVGLKVIIGMENQGNEWAKDDSILDPGTGKLFAGRIWEEQPGVVKVRGYLGYLYRTQTWYKVY